MPLGNTAPVGERTKGLTENSAADVMSERRSSARLAMELLGGHRVLHRHVASDEDAHELVTQGIPAAAVARLFAAVSTLSAELVLGAIGISERSLARRRAAPKARLPISEGERLWRFAEILAHATRVLGSQEEAERWLSTPAIWLDRRRPIDLVRTYPGARMVAEYLTRMEYGVYA